MYDFHRHIARGEGDRRTVQSQYLYLYVLKTTVLFRHVINIIENMITVCRWHYECSYTPDVLTAYKLL
jgi:hypothetical protein